VLCWLWLTEVCVGRVSDLYAIDVHSCADVHRPPRSVGILSAGFSVDTAVDSTWSHGSSVRTDLTCWSIPRHVYCNITDITKHNVVSVQGIICAGVVENSSHRKIIPTRGLYGLDLRLKIGLNLGLRLGLALALVTLWHYGGGKNFPGATNFPQHRYCSVRRTGTYIGGGSFCGTLSIWIV